MGVLFFHHHYLVTMVFTGLILLLSLVPLPTISFNIVNTSQNTQYLYPGESLTLICQSDSHWEFCRWTQRSQDTRVTNQKTEDTMDTRNCLLEWKRAKGGVSVETCDHSLVSRVLIAGDYDKHQCGITIPGVQIQDTGAWQCEMEEYQFTDLVAGDRHSYTFEVTVDERQTTVKDFTTPYTTMETTVEETTLDIEETTLDIEETTLDIVETTTEDEETIKNNDNNQEVTTKVDSEQPTFKSLPLEQDKSNPVPDDAPIVGISVGVSIAIVLVAALVVGVVRMKMHNSEFVASLQKLKEEEACFTNIVVEEVEVTKVTMSHLIEQ